jgi:hypothetical protein
LRCVWVDILDDSLDVTIPYLLLAMMSSLCMIPFQNFSKRFLRIVLVQYLPAERLLVSDLSLRGFFTHVLHNFKFVIIQGFPIINSQTVHERFNLNNSFIIPWRCGLLNLYLRLKTLLLIWFLRLRVFLDLNFNFHIILRNM